MVKYPFPARSPPPLAAGSERSLWSDMLLFSSIDSLTNGTRPLGSIKRKNSSEMQSYHKRLNNYEFETKLQRFLCEVGRIIVQWKLNSLESCDPCDLPRNLLYPRDA